jgi:hypothetical protein
MVNLVVKVKLVWMNYRTVRLIVKVFTNFLIYLWGYRRFLIEL